MKTEYTYALLLAASLLVPLLRSFESRIRFYQKWPALFAGIFVMMAVFIPWDAVFTQNKVWWFSHQHVLGLYLWGLPLEEWLFFIIIPFCVVFTYEVVRYFLPGKVFPETSRRLAMGLGLLFLVIAFLNTDKVYTLVVMALTAFLSLLQPIIRSHKSWLSHYYLTYLITLLPFFIINGVLTALPVVSYDNTRNLGIRLFSIPIEDAVYLMGMMLIVMMVYEAVKSKD